MKSDEELMQEASQGDMDSFEELICRYQNSAWNVAYSMLSDRHLAADAAQEAFLRVLEQAKTYRPAAKFSTYFFSILRRICIDHYRRKKASPRPDFARDEAATPPPEEILIKNETSLRIHEAIASLPPRQRMALTLQHFGQMSYKEIARAMNCSAGAVDSLLIRARGALSKSLKDL